MESRISRRFVDQEAEDLLRRQADLQAEAREVLDDLALFDCLRTAGRVEQVGSSVSGLMVWRDLDLSVTGPGMTADRAWAAVRPLLIHPQVVQVLYRLETGERSPTGHAADERFYYVLRYLRGGGVEWKIDVAFWLPDGPRGLTQQLEELARRLTDETRLAILRIKESWHRLPGYPDEVGGVDIYEAVLDHGVRTPQEFAAFLHHQGRPVRD